MAGKLQFNPCVNCCNLACKHCTFDEATGPHPPSWVVDLGAGPNWVDGACGYCDQIVGQITLTRPPGGTPSGFDTTCYWNFRTGDDFDCVYTGPPPLFTGEANTLLMQFHHAPWVSTPPWWFQLDIDLESFANQAYHTQAEYRSSTSEDEDCWDPGTIDGWNSSNKMTLTKVDEFVGGYECTGSLPTTIKIWVP